MVIPNTHVNGTYTQLYDNRTCVFAHDVVDDETCGVWDTFLRLVLDDEIQLDALSLTLTTTEDKAR